MSSLASARSHILAEPLYLVEIRLMGTGSPVLHLAEREIDVGGTVYEGHLWEIKRFELGFNGPDIRGMDDLLKICLLNEPWRGYSRLLEMGEDFPFEGATIILRETYIGPDGMPATPDLLLSGVLEGVSGIDLMMFTIGARGLWSLGGMM